MIWNELKNCELYDWNDSVLGGLYDSFCLFYSKLNCRSFKNSDF